MTDIDLKTLTPDTSLPTTGFLFGADSQASTNPSVYSTQTVATTLLGSTSLTGDTLTASSPVLNLTQEWSNGSVAFTGIRYNVTNTNSATASLLMDLQVGGTSQFNVRKDGFMNAYSVAFSSAVGINYFNQGYVTLRASGQIEWTNGTDFRAAGQDLFLTRKAAANLQLGAADAASPVAQTLSVQSIVGGLTGTPNLSAAAYPFTITGAQGTGTGAGGSIVFQVAPAGGSGTAQNALQTALTIASDAKLTIASNNPVTPSSGLTQIAMGDRGVVMSIYGTGYGTQPLLVSASGGISIYNDTGALRFGASGDVILNRDAANVLALKNSTNAQELRVYETTTGSIYKALLGNRQLMKISGASFTDGAGASAGTLTNAPAVGNPTKWIPIDDNGTTRYIPAW